jgi:hypothetical protein
MLATIGTAFIAPKVGDVVRYWQLSRVRERPTTKQVADAKVTCKNEGGQLDATFIEYGPAIGELTGTLTRRLIVKCSLPQGAEYQEMTYLKSAPVHGRR